MGQTNITYSTCSFCKEPIPKNTTYRSCTPCDWDMCMDCIKWSVIQKGDVVFSLWNQDYTHKLDCPGDKVIDPATGKYQCGKCKGPWGDQHVRVGMRGTVMGPASDGDKAKLSVEFDIPGGMWN